MHAHILGYSQGWRWIADGFALWRRAPALTSYVSFAYVLILLLASSLPYLGQLIAPLLMPWFLTLSGGNKAVAFIIFAAAFIIACVAALCLPERKGLDLED